MLVKDADNVTVAQGTQADASGKYVFSTFPPGTYSVSVSATVGGQITDVVVEDFRMTSVEVELK